MAEDDDAREVASDFTADLPDGEEVAFDDVEDVDVTEEVAFDDVEDGETHIPLVNVGGVMVNVSDSSGMNPELISMISSNGMRRDLL